MSTSKKLLINLFFNVISLILIIFISFYIANKNINLLIKKDLENVALSIDSLISIFAENDSKGWQDNKFKEAIKKIKIGKSGYVYFVDEKDIRAIVEKENPSGRVGDLDIPELEKKINALPAVDSANVYLNLNGKLNGVYYVCENLGSIADAEEYLMNKIANMKFDNLIFKK